METQHAEKTEWWADPENLFILCQYLVNEKGWDAHEILQVIEKPWNFTAKYEKARRHAQG